MEHFSQLRLTIPGSSGNLGPGFDCLGLALGIYNHFLYHPADNYSISFSGKVKMDTKFTDPQNNLVVKSYEYACQTIEQDPRPFSLDIEANIPIAAGLGSSGTAILAGCVMALVQQSPDLIAETNMSDKMHDKMSEELLQLASRLEGHPDNVAPSIYGGFVLSRQDEKSKRYHSHKFEVDSSIQCLIIKPQVETITAESRQTLPAGVSRQDAIFNISHAALVATAFATKDYGLLHTAVADKMHEQYRDTSYNYSGLKSKLLEEGALAVSLSGSGPSVLILTYAKNQQNLNKVAADHFQQIGLEYEDILMPVDNRGTLINDNIRNDNIRNDKN